MPEDKTCKLPQPQKKRKKKKKQKAEVPNSLRKDTDEPHPVPSEPLPVSLLPAVGPPRGQLPKLKTPLRKDSEKHRGGSRKSKKPSLSLLGLVCKSSGSPVQSYMTQLSAQARDSLRWEGMLDNPQEEEDRQEVYRANRRQRYIAHREMQLRETEEVLK